MEFSEIAELNHFLGITCPSGPRRPLPATDRSQYLEAVRDRPLENLLVSSPFPHESASQSHEEDEDEELKNRGERGDRLGEDEKDPFRANEFGEGMRGL
ncbi:MAG: hypothetical protein P4L67_03620 [Candidatus Pacebacteria bacterium]|nr:hypothetical protein [Candidatus Paceibacterota bacterium]